MDLQSNPISEVLYINFNQDFTCFVCGTESGFRVYSTEPFRLTHQRVFENGGGLGVIAMMFRTNVLAFAGGGRSPRFQPHKVVLWDDRQARIYVELGFRSTVRSVLLRRDLVVVAVHNKVFVYSFPGVQHLDSIETASNPKGLCALSDSDSVAVLVCPGLQQGRALVVFYTRPSPSEPLTRLRTAVVAAHDSWIAALATDSSGALMATASDRGTIIRVFESANGARLQEMRRGVDRAEIHSICFSRGSEFLAVSSDKGTIHVFALHCRSGSGSGSGSRVPASVAGPGAGSAGASWPGGNARSSLQKISRVLPSYFSSEWSLAQYRVPDCRCISCFGSDPRVVIIVCANGSFYKVRFNAAHGGPMVREEFAQFDDVAVEGSAGVCPSGALGPGLGLLGLGEAGAESAPDPEPSDLVPSRSADVAA